MGVGEQRKVGEGFVAEAKRGQTWKYVKCRGGGESARSLSYLLVVLFFSFFFFVIMYSWF